MESSSESSAAIDDPISGEAASKSRWRRMAEVLVPVTLFAVAVPLAVNGFASAVDSVGSSSTTTTIDVAAADTAPNSSAPPADIAQEIVGSVITEPTATTSAPATATADTATAAVSGEGSPSAGHSHGTAVAEQPLTRSERTELADQLVLARATAMKYPTVADATAAGYTMVTTYLPLIGAHYIKGALMDGTFDVTQPEMLLYDGTKPASHIVGLSYYMFSDTEPSPFAGPNDHWHQHIGLCIKAGVVVGGSQLTNEQCAARGGAKAGLNNGWMIHAWVVPGWESPQGVFSPEHPGLIANLNQS